ncbi:MAG: T9SS C-terminal target domain-containing protein, partial [Bacteroidetes bacterium]
SEPRPVIIYVHGGSWKGGTKTNVDYKADLFTEHNYVFASINYRLSPNPPDTTISGVRFPIHPIDVAKAIGFVYENIHQLNGDPQNMHLIGHSAGAHLVNLVATNQYFLDLNGLSTADIGCVCSLDAGVFDLPFELEIADASRYLMLLNAFGLNEAFYHQASPLFNVEAGEDIPDFLLIHQGTPLRILKTEGFRDTLHAKGHPGTSFNAFPYSHGGINTGLGAPEDSIGMTDLVLEFFAGCSGQTTSSFDLEDVSEVEELVVYPNPSDGRIYFPDPEVREVTVFDVLGKEIGRWSVNDSQLNLTHLGKGIYFIQASQEAGRKKVGKIFLR